MDIAGFVTTRVDGFDTAVRRLTQGARSRIGRRERHAFSLREEWIPRDLAELIPIQEGWLIENGGRTRMRVRNTWIEGVEAFFSQRAMVMLQQGTSVIDWPELDGSLSLTVTIRNERATDRDIPYAVGSEIDAGRPVAGTNLRGREVEMSPGLKHRMAVLFRHLIERSEPPANLCETAAKRLGTSEQAVKNSANRYRQRLNASRGRSLETLEQLGYYLVVTSEAIGTVDLDPASRGLQGRLDKARRGLGSGMEEH